MARRFLLTALLMASLWMLAAAPAHGDTGQDSFRQAIDRAVLEKSRSLDLASESPRPGKRWRWLGRAKKSRSERRAARLRSRQAKPRPTPLLPRESAPVGDALPRESAPAADALSVREAAPEAAASEPATSEPPRPSSSEAPAAGPDRPPASGADPAVRLEATAEGVFLSSRDGETRLEIDGRLFVDLTSFEGAFSTKDDGESGVMNERRSSMLRIRGPLRKNLRLFVQYETERRDLIIGSMTWRNPKPRVDVTFGLLKEPFGFEFQSTRRHLATMERPLIQVLNPGISLGVRVRGRKEHFSYAGGVFADNEDRDRKGVTGRFIWLPVLNDDRVIHFGLSASHRDHAGQSLSESTQGPVRAARIGRAVVGAPGVKADATTQVGVEAVGIRGRLTWQVEAMAEKVDAVDPAQDATYAGFYAQSTWFLRGARRTYQTGANRFGPTKPARKRNALELVGRWEHIDLDSGAIHGTRVESWLVGLNWHRSKNVKVMTQVARARVSGRGAAEALGGRGRIGYAVSTRFIVMV